MKTRFPVNLLTSIVFFFFISLHPAAYPGVEFGNGFNVNEKGGIEIGNAKGVIENLEGFYRLKIFSNWEIASSFQLSEAIAPLSAGAPRGLVQIDVIHSDSNEVTSLEGLFQSGWQKFNAGSLSGAIAEISHPGQPAYGRSPRKVEIRLLRSNGEFISITLSARYDQTGSSDIELLVRLIHQTFEDLLEHHSNK